MILLNGKLASCSTGGVVWLFKMPPLPHSSHWRHILYKYINVWMKRSLILWRMIAPLRTDCTDSDRQCCRDEPKTEQTLGWRGENCVLVAAYSNRTSSVIFFRMKNRSLTNIKCVSQYAWRVFPPAPLYLIVCLNKIPLFLRKKKIEIERSWWGQGL